MRHASAVTVLAFAVLASAPVLAQEAPAVTTKGHAPSVATTAYAGTIQQTVDITIASPIAPSGHLLRIRRQRIREHGVRL